MVYIICHVNEAFMMWKKTFISIHYLCSFPITGKWLVVHCFMFYLLTKPWSFTVQDLQASSNEAKLFSYGISYFKPRVSKGTYINGSQQQHKYIFNQKSTYVFLIAPWTHVQEIYDQYLKVVIQRRHNGFWIYVIQIHIHWFDCSVYQELGAFIPPKLQTA